VAKRVHPFTYYLPKDDSTRSLRIHERRDLGAALELLPALRERGYEHGEQILNATLEVPAGATVPAGDLYPVDRTLFRPGDLILQTTRPPLDDAKVGNRKKVRRGNTDLERNLFEVWDQYLPRCSRQRVQLAERVQQCLPEGFENRKEMVFFERTTAPYKFLNALDGRGDKRPPSDHLTAAFLLRVDRLWTRGPGLLGAFGMDGTSTMIWAYRLGRDLSYLLDEPGLTVVEMEVRDIPAHPTDLRWAADWKLKVLIQHRL